MTYEDLIKILSIRSENENIEFKEAKNSYSVLGKVQQKESVYGYCVAIGNEGGGKLILGVENKIDQKLGHRRIVGTKALENITDVKSQIYHRLNARINIEEIDTPDGRVVIITIPSHQVGQTFKFYGIILMRNGEEFAEMDDNTLANILNEKMDDFSASICDDATPDDLDTESINMLREKWAAKSGNEDFLKLSNAEVLEKLLLVRNGKVTNASIILLGKETAIAKFCPCSEIIFEWRGDKGKIAFDFKQPWRGSFIKIFDQIWAAINARNSRTPFHQGFIEFDIWAFNENSIREALLNAFAHREYRNRMEPVIIKASPEDIIIKSPGGFMPGVTPQNALFTEGKWRNRFLMEILEKIGLVERAGVGLDRIFRETISSGKGSPEFSLDDPSFVELNIPSKVKDINFVRYLQKLAEEKQIVLDELNDMLLLESVRTTGKIGNESRKQYFLKMNIIEKVGRGAGQRYILSKDFYDYLSHRGEYTRKKWLSKDQQKTTLLNFFKDHKAGRMTDFREIFEEKLNNSQINVLLGELRAEGAIYFDGKPKSKSAFWRIEK